MVLKQEPEKDDDPESCVFTEDAKCRSQLILMKPMAVNTKLIYHQELKPDTDILLADIKLTFR